MVKDEREIYKDSCVQISLPDFKFKSFKSLSCWILIWLIYVYIYKINGFWQLFLKLCVVDWVAKCADSGRQDPPFLMLIIADHKVDAFQEMQQMLQQSPTHSAGSGLQHISPARNLLKRDSAKSLRGQNPPFCKGWLIQLDCKIPEKRIRKEIQRNPGKGKSVDI